MNTPTDNGSTRREVDRLSRVYRGYAGNVAGKWSRDNRGNAAMLEERYHVLEEMLRRAHLDAIADMRILDVGCGAGLLLRHFAEMGAADDALFGVDLMPERIDAARANLPRGHFEVANAEALEFEDGHFDLVVLSTVLSSILDGQMRRNVVAEVIRVTAHEGGILIYDFRVPSPTNRHVEGISRREVRRLFPGWCVDARSLTLLPPLARRLGRATGPLYKLLARMPVLRTHNMMLLKRSTES